MKRLLFAFSLCISINAYSHINYYCEELDKLNIGKSKITTNHKDYSIHYNYIRMKCHSDPFGQQFSIFRPRVNWTACSYKKEYRDQYCDNHKKRNKKCAKCAILTKDPLCYPEYEDRRDKLCDYEKKYDKVISIREAEDRKKDAERRFKEDKWRLKQQRESEHKANQLKKE